MKLKTDECEESIIRKIRQRRDAGRKKYGTSMERTDLVRIDWLRHLQEELLDAAIYLEKLIQMESRCGNNPRATKETERRREVHRLRQAISPE